MVIDTAIERYGSCDILVNNAATNPHAGPLIDVPLSMWDKTHEVNLRGPLAWTQIAWNTWMAEHGGSVINIASVGGFKTSTALGVYAVFKSALIHMTKQMAAEMGPKVRVNCIAPGLIKTDFARILWEGERGKQVAEAYPLKRLGEPSDIGEAAVFLSSSAVVDDRPDARPRRRRADPIQRSRPGMNGNAPPGLGRIWRVAVSLASSPSRAGATGWPRCRSATISTRNRHVAGNVERRGYPSVQAIRHRVFVVVSVAASGRRPRHSPGGAVPDKVGA